MSRGFIGGILVLLLGLLGVMSFLVKKPDAKTNPEEEQAKAQQTQTAAANKPDPKKQAEMMKQQMQQRQTEMKEMMKRAERGKSAPGQPGSAAKKPPVATGRYKPPAGTMDITHTWYQERQPGEAGVEKLAAEKAAEDAQVKTSMAKARASAATKKPEAEPGQSHAGHSH